MFREWGKELVELLRDLGVDVGHFATLVFVLLVLSHYYDFKNWDKIDRDRKFWIGAVIYGCITFLTISLLRIFGVLNMDL